jgi:competence protein ComEC
LRTAIAPFLRSEGRSSVDELLLSHGDFDHINAAAGLIADYHLRQVEISPHFRRHATESATARHLLQSLDRAHHSPRLLTRGDHLDLGSDVKLDVLWPPPAGTMTSNNAGLVLRLTFAGKSILFPADIQEPAEAELLRDPAQLRADVLIAPHHGSTESTTAGFVRAVNPKLIVSSDEHRLTSKQRKFEQLIGGHPLYRTGQCGAVVITINKMGNIKAAPFLKRRATGWEQND